MSDDVKPTPERPDIGRVAVCSIGYIGIIDGIGDMPWGEAWIGRGVVTGAPWSSRQPTVLSPQDERWVLSLAERVRQLEADAARLDWLERAAAAPLEIDNYGAGFGESSEKDRVFLTWLQTGERIAAERTLRDSIDAAMKAGR